MRSELDGSILTDIGVEVRLDRGNLVGFEDTPELLRLTTVPSPPLGPTLSLQTALGPPPPAQDGTIEGKGHTLLEMMAVMIGMAPIGSVRCGAAGTTGDRRPITFSRLLVGLIPMTPRSSLSMAEFVTLRSLLAFGHSSEPAGTVPGATADE